MIEPVASSVIVPYEYRAADIQPKGVAIKEAASSINIGKPLMMLMQSCPSLNETTQRLAEHITNLFPSSDTDRTLLAWTLEDGLKAYRKAGSNGGDTKEMQTMFLHAMLTRAADVMFFDVRAVDGMGEGERWESLRTPLAPWIRNHAQERIVFTERLSDDAERDAARVLLAGQILSISDAKALRKLRGI